MRALNPQELQAISGGEYSALSVIGVSTGTSALILGLAKGLSSYSIIGAGKGVIVGGVSGFLASTLIVSLFGTISYFLEDNELPTFQEMLPESIALPLSTTTPVVV